MKTLRLLLVAALALALNARLTPVLAQSAALTVGSCGAASYAAGQQFPLQQTQTGTLCTNATLSGSVTVGNATITAPLGAQTSAASVATTINGALPAGTNVIGHVITDTGSVTNATLQAGSAIAGKFGIDQTTPGTTNGVQVNAALPAGSNIIGNVDIDQTTPGTTNGVAIAPTSAAGVAITSVVSAAAENNHVLKASAGNLYSAYATNLTTTAGFLEIFNATTAPADGAVTPIACVALPPTGTASLSRGAGPPQRYSTGITAVVSSASTCFTKTTGTITAFISGDVQ